MNGPYFIIVNPKAGGGRTERLWPALQRRLDASNVEYSWKRTAGPRHATLLAGRAPTDATVVVVGGDGTVTECVAGLARHVPVGIIPTGACNDFARSVGISASPFEAIEQLTRAEHREIDVPEVNGIPFLSALGIGHGVEMARSTQRFAKRISVVDLFQVVLSLPRYQAPELSISLDGEESRGKVFLLAIGNGRYFSGGLNVCPRAHCDDGLLDVCIAGDLRRAEAVLALSRLFRGTHIRQRKFHYAKAHSITIDGPNHIPIVADGQSVSHLPAQITMNHRALAVLVPPGVWTSSKVTSIWRRRRPESPEEASP